MYTKHKNYKLFVCDCFFGTRLPFSPVVSRCPPLTPKQKKNGSEIPQNPQKRTHKTQHKTNKKTCGASRCLPLPPVASCTRIVFPGLFCVPLLPPAVAPRCCLPPLSPTKQIRKCNSQKPTKINIQSPIQHISNSRCLPLPPVASRCLPYQ